MAKASMTVRVEARSRKALDKIAERLDRDRSYVVNQAIESYIDVYRWQAEHIRQGLREAKEGQFVPRADVDRLFRKLLRTRK